MIRFYFLFVIVALAVSIKVQAQVDTAKKQKDTVAGPILYPEIVKVEGAKPVFTKESQELATNKATEDGGQVKNLIDTSPQAMLQAPASNAGPTLGQLDVSATGGAHLYRTY